MVYFIIVAAILIHGAHVLAYQEELLPYQNDDDSMYLYMDTRAVKDTQDKPREYDIEARRRSVLEKNFIRLGRRDPLQKMHSGYENEYDDYVDAFTRPTRSGNSEKNDRFVRFGRGKSDFVRFGRDSNKERNLRDKDINFIRFGRSIEQPKTRNKRDVYNPEYKRNGNSFLRFGKNDHFMRFGRKEEDTPSVPINKNDEEQRQSDLIEKFNRYPDSSIIRLLTNLAYKLKDNSKCSRLLE